MAWPHHPYKRKQKKNGKTIRVLKLGVWMLNIPFLSNELVGFFHNLLLLGSGPTLGIKPELFLQKPGRFLGTSKSGTSTLPAYLRTYSALRSSISENSGPFRSS